MDAHLVLRQLLRAPSSYGPLMRPATRPQARTFALLAPHIARQQRYFSVPRIVQPSFWVSMIPRPFRGNASEATEPVPTTTSQPKQWNPATPYIILGLLVGSQAIQILWIKRERDHYTRRAEVQIGVLREVIERVQNGEEVDVEKVLGTGDAGAEQEWKGVLKDIEEEELLYRSKKRRRAARAEKEAEEKKAEHSAVIDTAQEEANEVVTEDAKLKVETYKGARFY